MPQEEIEKLIDKYLTGKATEQEREQFNQWYNSFDDETVIVPAGENEEKEKTRKKMLVEIRSRIAVQKTTSNIRILKQRKPAFLKIAATIAIVSSIAYGLYHILPGPEIASVPVALTKKSAMAGQKLTTTLADGSVVRLNSQSTLSFAENFNGNTRAVVLQGEAFFEVARDDAKPFIVTAGGLTTTVLGTSFNVKAYPEDDRIQVSVATGEVLVTLTSSPAGSGGIPNPLSGQTGVLLTPNQAAKFNTATRNLEKIAVNTENLVAWKDGWLIFESRKMGEVVSVLERWYGVKILLKDEELKQKRVTLKQHHETLKAVLEILSYLADFEYRIENEEVIITRNK